MRETRITFPELALVAGTRMAFGVGLGLLLADRIPAEQRRAVGRTLCLVGALTTIPLAFEVLGHRVTTPAERVSTPAERVTSASGVLMDELPRVACPQV
jgi:hypothetical protein